MSALWPLSARRARPELPRKRDLLPALVLAAIACSDGESQQPKITRVDPNRTAVGVEVETTVTGERFMATVRMKVDDGDAPVIDRGFSVRLGNRELAGDAVRQLSTEQLTVQIPADLAIGVYNVSVRTPADRWATLPNAFTVDSGAPGGGQAGTSPESAGFAGASGQAVGQAGTWPETAGFGGTSGQEVGQAGTWPETAGFGGTSGQEVGQAGTSPESAGFGGTSGQAGDGAAAGSSGTSSNTSHDAYSCSQPLDSATLALYYFEDNLDDATGAHPTSLAGDTVEYVPGPPECGEALALRANYHVRIDDSSDWELDTGSVDFWFLPGHIPQFDPEGILSRDSGDEPAQGHITFFHAGDGSGRIVVRMQDGSDLYVCSNAALEVGAWVHIGLNFGAPRVELYLDGMLQSYTGAVPFYEDHVTCSIEGTHGIAGNANPWVLGASAESATPGGDGPLRGALEDAGINALRISSERRPFGD